MSILPKLYVGGIRSGLRGLGRVGRRSRKELGVREADAPLGVAFRRGAHNATTTGEGQGKDRHKTDDNRCIQHLLWSRYCGEAAANGVVRCAAKVRLRCG